LPAQAPAKFESTIDLKSAKAFGLDVPPTLLALADDRKNDLIARRDGQRR
jgi:putative ABC transport system substrate-binding protein